jgi:CBS domain-containing protein
MRKMSDLIRDQSPLALPASTPIVEAARQMRQRQVGAALIIGGDSELIGIFTGRDAVDRVLAEGKNPAETTLGDVMTREPCTLTSQHRAIDALRLMQDARCRHLPIVQEGKLVGIVSRGDFRGIEVDRLDEETGLWERIG